MFVYEAGSCGFWIHREITALGHACWVVPPSLIPQRPGDHVKTDRRDSENLARLARAGELACVHVPDVRDEAVRDLVRARDDAVIAQRRARQQLKALLLRNEIRYVGKTSWTSAHLRWLSELKLPQPAQQIAFQEYVNAITVATGRIERLEQAMRDEVSTWRFAPDVAVQRRAAFWRVRCDGLLGMMLSGFIAVVANCELAMAKIAPSGNEFELGRALDVEDINIEEFP
ncbi:MAG: transposase [Betaproteobacteria bacterium]|nr:transposase [Betaproteobacteria bacterium]